MLDNQFVVKISPKGQLVLPVNARKALGWEEVTTLLLDVDSDNGKIVLSVDKESYLNEVDKEKLVNLFDSTKGMLLNEK